MVLEGSWGSGDAIAVGMHAMSVATFMAAGNVMNDLKDVEVDRVAHPERPLPSGRVTTTAARRLATALWVASLGLLAAGLSLLDAWLPSMVIWAAAAVLMVAYDHGPDMKSRGFVGNIAISVLVGAVVVFGAAAAGAWANPVALAAASVAALVNLAREVVKDVHDMSGDEGHRRTLPMAIGAENARMVAYVIALAGLVVLYVPYQWGPLAFHQLVTQTPAILLIITTNGPLWEGRDAVVVARYRQAMLAGLVGFLLSVLL
jgi:geranylgeranylglycerol-phosphate geranylgeranyltransferase